MVNGNFSLNSITMGEIADMMIDGELCEECGTYIGPPTGFPRKCSGCKPTRNKKKHKQELNRIHFNRYARNVIGNAKNSAQDDGMITVERMQKRFKATPEEIKIFLQAYVDDQSCSRVIAANILL
jgi:hypothetical protein